MEVDTVWFTLTNLEVARIEEHFDGTSGFDAAFEKSPQTTMRTFLCIALGSPVPVPGEALDAMSARMLPEQWPAYCAALETSWLLAHGGSEVEAGKVWTGKALLTQQGIGLTVTITEEAVRVNTSRGVSASARGRASAGTRRRSGG